MSFSIFSKSLGSLGTNCIVIANEQTKKLLVFDAPLGVESFIEEFEGYSIDTVFLTHGHFDHILGVPALVKMGAQLFLGHPGDRHFFETPEVMGGWMDPEEVKILRPVKISRWIKDGQEILAQGLKIEVRHTPGHSQGSVVFYIESLKTLISGDTLFRGSVGRSDLPGGSTVDLMTSIRSKVIVLEVDTKVYPGHGPSTTIGQERLENPYIN